MKPDKITFFEYYIAPVVRLVEAAGAAAENIYRRLAGRWYCEYCKQYHSRRTIKRYYGNMQRVCNLGMNREKKA